MFFGVSPVLALRARETNKRAEINPILWFRYAFRFALSYFHEKVGFVKGKKAIREDTSLFFTTTKNSWREIQRGCLALIVM